jgi:hypothetical protein
MTRFDIRVRRDKFTHSRIERHKNYQSLLDKHYEQSRKKTRGVMVLVFLLILIIAILLAFFNRYEAPANEVPQTPASEMGIDKELSTGKTTIMIL